MARRMSLLLLLVSLVSLGPAAGVSAGGGCHPGPDARLTSSDDRTIAIDGCAFTTTVVYIEPGEEVTWKNKDPVPHSVSGAAYLWGSEELLQQGDEVSYAFEKEGVFPYYCVLHPTMAAAVVVGDGGVAGTVIGHAKASGVTSAHPYVAPASTRSDPGGSSSEGQTVVLAVAGTVLALISGGLWFALRRFGGRVTSEA